MTSLVISALHRNPPPPRPPPHPLSAPPSRHASRSPASLHNLCITRSPTLLTAKLTPSPTSSPLPAVLLRIFTIVYGLFPPLLATFFSFIAIKTPETPSFVGLLLIQPLWLFAFFALKHFLVHSARDSELSISTALVTLTRIGAFRVKKRDVLLEDVRGFRVVTVGQSQSKGGDAAGGEGAFAYGVEVLCLGEKLVFGFVGDRDSAEGLVQAMLSRLTAARYCGVDKPVDGLFQVDGEEGLKGGEVVIDGPGLKEQGGKTEVGLVKWRRGKRGGVLVVGNGRGWGEILIGAAVCLEWGLVVMWSCLEGGFGWAGLKKKMVVGGWVACLIGMLLVAGRRGWRRGWVLGENKISAWKGWIVGVEGVDVKLFQRVVCVREEVARGTGGVDGVGGRRFGVRLEWGNRGCGIWNLTEGEMLFVVGCLKERYAKSGHLFDVDDGDTEEGTEAETSEEFV